MTTEGKTRLKTFGEKILYALVGLVIGVIFTAGVFYEKVSGLEKTTAELKQTDKDVLSQMEKRLDKFEAKLDEFLKENKDK